MDRLRYLASNENLLAIVHGLNLGSSDEVLCIAGAGDQALAILEYSASVLAVDQNARQLKYLEKQLLLLAQHDDLSFLRPEVLMQKDPHLGFEIGDLLPLNDEGLTQRRRYFHPKRLHAIRNRLHCLQLSDATVLEAASEKIFDKIYLSNILGYLDSDFTPKSLLFLGANRLRVGGLLYISNGKRRADPEADERMRSLGLILDVERTQVARSLDANWNPSIFCRIR